MNAKYNAPNAEVQELMRLTFHRLPSSCALCGKVLHGPARHWADRINGKDVLYCPYCRNLITGRRKIKPENTESLNHERAIRKTHIENPPRAAQER